ncbi:MAG: TonB-dependent receptor, partial [Acidobacteriota bacterium]
MSYCWKQQISTEPRKGIVMRVARSLVSVAIVLVAASVCAQTTTGRLIGAVVDQDGAPLPGVSVTIASPALLGGPRTEMTDELGEIRFLDLAPGYYQVRAELVEFATQERREVKVRLGGAAALTITMPRARFEDEIAVVAETPVVDPIQSNMEQVFDRGYLDRAAIGSSGRSYVSVLFHAAGADDVGNSNPSVFGSTIGENAYYIDGVDTTDPVTSTLGVLLNFDAIQEIQIQTAGFEAEYGRAIGGMVNLVTKSGGNQFSGTLDVRYRDDAFYESGDHFDSGELDNEYIAAGFTLGGPIVR